VTHTHAQIFSNIGGTATGIGDPPNILIISNSQIKDTGLVDFSSFTLHVAPGAILAMCTTFLLVMFVYKKRICRVPLISLFFFFFLFSFL
jgi:Na+/H+ antiporter NhaD/arsenite permease-like protein